MAISFKKEVILEAIKAVLAEATLEVTTSDGTEASASPAQKEQIKDARAKGTSVVFKKTGETKPALEEDDHLNPNDESDMAKTQLYATAKYAIELLRMIQDGEQLDAWVQAKITKAADYIDAVKHYMEGEEFLAGTEAPGMEDEPVEEPIDEKMDPVGQEDDDINNDGKVDKTDKYLKNRRISISKAITQAKKK